MKIAFKSHYLSACLALTVFLPFFTGCQNNSGCGRRNPLVGQTRLPAPGTTPRAVYVQGNGRHRGNVVPGGVQATGPDSRQTLPPPRVAGRNSTPSDTTYAASTTTGSNVSGPGSGWVPVSTSPSDGRPTSVATGGSAEPYMTRYPGPASETGTGASDITLQWIPVSGDAAHATFAPAKPADAPEMSYMNRLPYEMIVPPPLQVGVVVPQDEKMFFPPVLPKPPAEAEMYCEENAARQSDEWVRSLQGTFTTTLPRTPRYDSFHEDRSRQIANIFSTPPAESTRMMPPEADRHAPRGASSWEVVTTPATKLPALPEPQYDAIAPAVGRQVIIPARDGEGSPPSPSVPLKVFPEPPPRPPRYMSRDPGITDLRSLPAVKAD